MSQDDQEGSLSRVEDTSKRKGSSVVSARSLSLREVPPEAKEAINSAVEDGDAERLRSLLGAHPDAARTVPWGDAGSLLHMAAEQGEGGAQSHAARPQPAGWPKRTSRVGRTLPWHALRERASLSHTLSSHASVRRRWQRWWP